jgi:hypothetical protein
MQHRLSEHDLEEGTAFCSGCGERVRIVSKGRCAIKTRDEKRAYKARLREEGRLPPARTWSAKPRLTGVLRSEARLFQKYGLTPGDVERMKAEQGGLCAICRRQDAWRLVVDHCHDTGRVRGLLCDRCNQALGALGDRVEALERALHYLRHAA